jgi:hypothetical protein
MGPTLVCIHWWAGLYPFAGIGGSWRSINAKEGADSTVLSEA